MELILPPRDMGHLDLAVLNNNNNNNKQMALINTESKVIVFFFLVWTQLLFSFFFLGSLGFRVELNSMPGMRFNHSAIVFYFSFSRGRGNIWDLNSIHVVLRGSSFTIKLYSHPQPNFFLGQSGERGRGGPLPPELNSLPLKFGLLHATHHLC